MEAIFESFYKVDAVVSKHLGKIFYFTKTKEYFERGTEQEQAKEHYIHTHGSGQDLSKFLPNGECEGPLKSEHNGRYPELKIKLETQNYDPNHLLFIDDLKLSLRIMKILIKQYV